MTNTKTCKLCGVVKEAEAFQLDKGKRRSRCKACVALKNRLRAEAKPNSRKARRLRRNDAVKGESGAIHIPITGGEWTVIDEDDAERVLQFMWALAVMPNGGRYARRFIRDGKRKSVVYLHRFILNAPDGTVVDHKNGDGLDNRRSNLRLANRSLNRMNTPFTRSPSGFKGVSRAGEKWDAYITKDGKTTYLGRFKTAELAARAYDQKARELFGDFAHTNFDD